MSVGCVKQPASRVCVTGKVPGCGRARDFLLACQGRGAGWDRVSWCMRGRTHVRAVGRVADWGRARSC